MRTSLRQGSKLLALVMLTACVDGQEPLGIDVPAVVTMYATPVFSVTPSFAEIADLTRARVTVRSASTDEVIASVEQDIDPSALQWTLDLSFEVSGDAVKLEAELASVASGVETVEWSGRTSQFQATASVGGPAIHEVDIFRGPLANLDIAGLTVTATRATLIEGESELLSVAIDGQTAGTRIFFEALDPDVATVDVDGRVRAVAPGSARIEALAGRISDMISFTVNQIVLPEPEDIEANVAPQVDYTSNEVAGSLGDAEQAAAISSTLGDLAAAFSSGNGATMVSAFESAAVAWQAYGSGTELRFLDGPQLSLVEITLIHAADALGIDFG